MTAHDKLLRTEAAPLDREYLLETEKRVFDDVLQCIKSAVGQPRADTIPGARQSRVALISGGRGLGKTTVMLSLSHEFSTARERKCKNEEVNQLAHRVIWLEPLAMERLSRSTNFIAAILVRIQQAIDKLLPEFATGLARTGLVDCLSDSPLHRLHQLTSEVALAWDGNLPERGAHIDPDTFAAEVVRAEKARLSLNEKFGTLLDDLAREISRSPVGFRDPVFVFPVDDFDVNPHRCLELLRFLRLLSVPRMFSLVLGDEEMIEAVFQLNAAGELAHPAGRTGWPGDKDLKSHIATTSAGIASQALRKLIPVGQRFRLGPMKVEEALAYKPLRAPDGTKNLGDLLSSVKVEIASGGNVLPGGDRANNVFAMIVADGLLSNEKFYTARKLLEAPPRHIADLWFMLESLTTKVELASAKAAGVENNHPEEEQARAEFCAELATQLIGEDSYLRDSHRRSASAVVRQIGQVSWQPGDWPLDFAHSSGHRTYAGTATPPCTIGLTTLWDWRRGLNYRTKDRESRTPAPRFDERLGNDSHEWKSIACGRTIAGLTLVRDMVSRGFGETGPRLSAWVMPLVWAEWETNVFVPWLFARWSTFWEYERFLSAWRTVLDSRWSYKTDKEFVNVLGYMWLAIPVAMTLGVGLLPKKDQLASIDENKWAELAANLGEMHARAKMKNATGFREFVDTYLVIAACLSCPESGLSTVAHKALTSEPLLNAYREGSVRRRILKARLHFLELFFEQGLFDMGCALLAPPAPGEMEPSPDRQPVSKRESPLESLLGCSHAHALNVGDFRLDPVTVRWIRAKHEKRLSK